MVQNRCFRTRTGSVRTKIYRANYSLYLEKIVDLHEMVKNTIQILLCFYPPREKVF